MLQFKSKRDVTLFTSLHPLLIMIFCDLYYYAYDKHGVRLVVTQTISDKAMDRKLNRKSPAHSQRRAIDIRTKDLKDEVVEDLLIYINSKRSYKKYHYQSFSGDTRLAYFHIGSGPHLHLAIHSKFAIK